MAWACRVFAPWGLLVVGACGSSKADELFLPAEDGGAVVPADASVPAFDAGLPDAREPDRGTALLLSASGLDFGRLPCGGASSPTRSLELRNVGRSSIAWQARVEGAGGFAVVGATEGSLAPGIARSVIVSAAPPPASARAGVAQEGWLVVTSDEGTHRVLLRATPSGGALFALPSNVSFGRVPLGGDASEVPIRLTNIGDQTISVLVGSPSDTAFSVAWTGAPQRISLPPGASMPNLVVGFRPTSTASFSAASAVTATGVICGDTPSLTFDGQGLVGTIGVSPTDVFFGDPQGRVDCGTQAAAKTIAVSNGGAGQFSFVAALGRGGASPFSIAPASGLVTANGHVDIVVTPKVLPGTASTSVDAFGDTLTITTQGIVGDVPRVVTLHQTARGARLRWSESSIDFGDVLVGAIRTLPWVLLNDGNAPASVSWTTTAPFSILPASATVAAGASANVAGAFSPTAASKETASVSISTSPGDVLCAALPTALPLAGRGTMGALTVSSVALDYGRVPCGGQAAPQNLTLRNDGDAAFDYALSFGAGSTRFAASVASGSLAPGGSSVITITPVAVPSASSVAPDAVGDVLTVTTTIPGSVPRQVPLHQTAEGAILVFVPSSIPLGAVAVGGSASASLVLRNEGNVTAPVTLFTSDGSLQVSPAFDTLASGGELSSLVTFSPVASGPYLGHVSVSAPSVTLCAPVPSASVDAMVP